MGDFGGFGGGMMGVPGYGGGMFGQDPLKKKKKDGFNPLMMLSPLGWGLMEHPKYALPFISPGIGIANLLGAFK